MRFLIYTAMNDRHAIARLFCLGMARFIADAPDGVTVEVLAVISEKESEKLCKEFGFHFCYSANLPLGKKWNTGIDYALKNLQWDYMLRMGDDDLIASKAWDYFLYHEGSDCMGFKQLYFYSPQKKEALHFTYDGRTLLGCGTVMSRKLVETSAPLYKDDINKQLDHSSSAKLRSEGFNELLIITEETLFTDVKSEKNIWPFERFKKNSTPVTVDESLWFIGQAERDYITQHLVNS